MLRAIASLGLAASLLACGGPVEPRTQQVPLAIDESAEYGFCVLAWAVFDFVADPLSGEPRAEGHNVKWPRGYTAWRIGTESEVVAPSGVTVLTTGRRYWSCPVGGSPYGDEWLIGEFGECEPGEFIAKIGRECDIGAGAL